jgi:hypothetical protein
MNENVARQDDEVPVPLGLVEQALQTDTSAAQPGDRTGPWPYLDRGGAPAARVQHPSGRKAMRSPTRGTPEMEEVG